MTKTTKTVLYAGGALGAILAAWQWYRWNVIRQGDLVLVDIAPTDAPANAAAFNATQIPARVLAVDQIHVMVRGEGPYASFEAMLDRNRVIRILEPA